MEKRDTVILIPALNPPPELETYVKELKEAGFGNILLVDDGSDQERYGSLFHSLEIEEGCRVLRHGVNLGKGRALKNGINDFLVHYGSDPDVKGMITADSDGQHQVEDVVKLDEALRDLKEDALILGTRSFNYDFVPFKSKWGNKLTSGTFFLLFGRKLGDTQTGLRGIPRGLMAEYIDLSGERFEYETNQLIHSVRKKIPFQEVPIETIYKDNNSETHFNPIRDSLAIYKLLFASFFKYIFSSLSSAILDIGLFQVILWLLGSMLQVKEKIWIATVGARAVSSLYNYMVNKNVVFQSDSPHSVTMIRYYLLCVAQMLCSAGLVAGLTVLFHLPAAGVKIVVDTGLFFISYHIQKQLVFVEAKKGRKK